MKLRILAATALAAIGLAGAVACGGGGTPDGDPTAHATFAPTTNSQGRDFGKSAGQVASEAADKLKPTTPAPKPLTVEQRNANQTAADYLDGQSFSRKGLIKQLGYEGFPVKVATAAVDSLHANWNEQAALTAQSYLDGQSFSRASLIRQLKYEGFTTEQATYGVKKAGL